ncbi:MAG: hypothetical protein JNM84_11915 [Planctomycetes bacterium]|nr:hypothetical protein [Planctomycetota bacterium]
MSREQAPSAGYESADDDDDHDELEEGGAADDGAEIDLGALLGSIDSPAEALERLVRLGARQREWKSWKRLAQHDYEAAEEELAAWLEEVLREDPPPPETQAFFFGLFDAEDDDGKETFGLQIGGSSFFAPFDRTFAWAAEPDWVPDDCFAPEGILDEIYRLSASAPREQRDFARYTIGLAYAVIAVKRLCARFAKKLELWQQGGRQVAVGFLGGEAILLPDPQANPTTEIEDDEELEGGELDEAGLEDGEAKRVSDGD